MSRRWKSGDIAMVTDATCEVRPMILTGPPMSAKCWHGVEENGSLRCLDASQAGDIRPLVVIDPEDMARVADLAGVMMSHGCRAEVDLQSALREYANPTPPKPPEPMGLGAVVEDDHGDQWVRVAPAGDGLSRPWARVGQVGDTSSWRGWHAFSAVRVLTTGVTL